LNIDNLPYDLQRDLASAPATKGNRHDNIRSLSLRLVGEGWPDNDIFTCLRERYPTQEKSNKEITDLIRGAHKCNPKSSFASPSRLTYQRPAYQRAYQPQQKIKALEYKPSKEAQSGTLELPTSPLSIEDFLKLAFKPGEIICINKNAREVEGKWTISSSGTFMSLERWLDFLSSTAGIFDEPQGAWIRVNPFIPDRYNGKNEDVSVFRHLLIESDKLPKAQQWEIYQQSGLPITAVIDSAGSSLHAWVRVDAENAEQYKERTERVYETLVPLGFDAGNKNPSRFSRLPGAVRNGKPQSLIATNIGAGDWDEWEGENDDDGFRSKIENRLDLNPEVDLIKQPEIIHGVLRQMDRLVLGASSKAGKTWVLMDLFVSITYGVDWLGIPTNECRALYLNFELHAPSFKQRILDIEKAKGLTRPSGLMDWWNLRDEGASIDTVVPRIIKSAKRKNYSIIILDPTYEMLGDRDENKASDMNDLMNYLGKLSVATNAAIVFAAHFSKGSQEWKEAIHRISGSGVFSRKPDCIVTMTEHEVDEAFTVDFKLRDYSRKASFVVQRDKTIFQRADSLNPQKLRRSGNRNPVYTVDLLLESLGRDELTSGEWGGRCKTDHGMSQNTFLRLRKELIGQQRVYRSKMGGKFSKTSRELEKSDS